MKLLAETQEALLALAQEKNIYIEGNILKIFEVEENSTFSEYVNTALALDKDKQRKRLAVTKQVQDQNKLLQKKAEENDNLMQELKEALSAAEEAKQAAVNDLDIMQKKRQFQLIGDIVTSALWVIMGVGVVTTFMYVLAIFHESNETTLIGNTWSNLFGILLTNSFSIIGTIMGVKYASDKKDEQ